MIEQFVAGLVGSPFGVKGFVKVRPLSGETGHLAALEQAVLRRGGKEEVWEIEETALAAPSLLVKFKGIDTPEDAKTLGGAELLIDRAHAAPLKEGEFYIEDLKGLALVAADGSGEILGHITDVLEGGGGQLAEVQLNSGGRRLVPFRNEFLGDIDLRAGTAELLETWILE